MRVRDSVYADAEKIGAIYNHYIESSHATFETEPVSSVEMLHRIEEALSAGYPFLVCEDDDDIVGYAYGRRFRPRSAYRHSIEISVYVKPGCSGRSVGSLLYEHLLAQVRESGRFHAVIGGISLPNDASVRLHERFDFEKVAHFRQVGRKFDRWIDVAYWQLIL
jgi:phosphinothricin acetyltransferase